MTVQVVRVLRTRATSWLLVRAHRRSEIGLMFSNLADDVERVAEKMPVPFFARESGEALLLSVQLRGKAQLLATLASYWLRLARFVSPHALGDEAPPPPLAPRRRRETVH